MGDVNACFFIGFSFHKGLHENDNPNAAVPTTSKPGEGGTELCAKDITQCLTYLERAATGGHSKALLYLHQMYKNADGVEKDLTKSKDYLIKAMRLGDPEALFIRGNQFYAGEDGEEVDKEKALKMFLDAGARGNADAMCSAGAMIYNGEGQERDLCAVQHGFHRVEGAEPADRDHGTGDRVRNGGGSGDEISFIPVCADAGDGGAVAADLDRIDPGCIEQLAGIYTFRLVQSAAGKVVAVDLDRDMQTGRFLADTFHDLQ